MVGSSSFPNSCAFLSFSSLVIGLEPRPAFKKPCSNTACMVSSAPDLHSHVSHFRTWGSGLDCFFDCKVAASFSVDTVDSSVPPQLGVCVAVRVNL